MNGTCPRCREPLELHIPREGECSRERVRREAAELIAWAVLFALMAGAFILAVAAGVAPW